MVKVQIKFSLKALEKIVHFLFGSSVEYAMAMCYSNILTKNKILNNFIDLKSIKAGIFYFNFSVATKIFNLSVNVAILKISASAFLLSV